MTSDTSALVIRFALLAAIILAPWLYKRSKSEVCLLRPGLKKKSPGHTPVCDRSRSEARNPSHASQARRRILGHKHCNYRLDAPCFTQSGLRTGSIFGQVRNTTVQVWTVGKGLGIGSEFSQTCCAANNFRDHEVLLPRFKGTGD
jgi:hypothetical protein